MNTKISMFLICVEAIIYLLLYNLHDCTFKIELFMKINKGFSAVNYFPKNFHITRYSIGFLKIESYQQLHVL